MIPRFAETLFAVFDGFCRAVADAGHAVGAVLAPDRFAVMQGDIVGGTTPDTLTAADAGAAYSEGIRLNKERVEERIDSTAHEAIVEVAARRGKVSIRLNGGDGALNTRLGIDYDFSRFVRLRGIEHGNIVFRHDNLCRAHIGKVLCFTEGLVVFIRIANLAAAGHDKPRPLRADEVSFQQPVLHDAGNAPGIGGRNEYNSFAGLNWRRISGFDAVIHIEKRIVQCICDALRYIFAVTGAEK